MGTSNRGFSEALQVVYPCLFPLCEKKCCKKIWIFGYKGIPLQSQFGKYMSSRFGKREDSLAQLVEHNTFNVGVLGSNPKRITKLAFKMAFMTLP